jgi:prepilin-type N-terminal cleavage/methylation domain-containing protein
VRRTAQADRQAARRGRGFTITELIVVIAIIAILSALTIPSIAPLVASKQAANAAGRLRMTMMSTRARAMSEGRRFSVIFNTVVQDADAANYGEPSVDSHDHWYAVVRHEGIDGAGNPTGIDAPGFHVATQADAAAAADPDNTLALAAFLVGEIQRLEPHECLFFALSAQDNHDDLSGTNTEEDYWYQVFPSDEPNAGAPMWDMLDPDGDPEGSWGYTESPTYGGPGDNVFAITFYPNGEIGFRQPNPQDADPAPFPDPPNGEQKIGIWGNALTGNETHDRAVELNSQPTAGLSINRYTGEIDYDNPRSYSQVDPDE